MRIVMLAENFPFPPVNGMRSVIYNSLLQLAKQYEIHLISFYQNKADLSHVDHLLQYCSSISCLPVKALGLWDIIKNFFAPYPLSLRRYPEKGLKEVLAQVIAQQKIDLVHCWGINMGQFINLFPDLPSVIAPNDFIAWRLKRGLLTKGCVRGPKKIYQYMQYLKMLKYEKYVYSRFSKFYFLSFADAAKMEEILPFLKPEIIPMGVDTDYFSPLQEKVLDSSTPSLVFSGAMSGLENQDAVVFFATKIFPKILAKVSNCKFYIVGGKPTQKVVSLGKNNPNIVVTGFVKDLRTYVQQATVFVSPLRMGTGIKTKLMEAMSMGKAIVATTISCEGIPTKDGEHLLIADNAEDFAARAIDLLADQARRQELGHKARSLVLEQLSWPQIARRIDNLYNQIGGRQ